MLRKRLLFAPLAAAALVLGACEDTSGPGDGDAHLRVLLTDAPADYLESAVVEIGRIELLPADEDDERVVIVEDGGVFDLLDLQHGVTAELASLTLEPGAYREMRMIVESAELTLAEPYTFEDGSITQSLNVPSGAQSGIKVRLHDGEEDGDDGVEIRPGETVLVVDFDVSQNFVMQGNAETPAGIKGFLFTPRLHAVVRDVAGSISGTVSAPAEVELEGLQVTALPVGADADDTPRTALVEADGTYTIHFVAPDVYDVTVAAPAGYVATTVEVDVDEDEDVSDVDLEISAEESSG